MSAVIAGALLFGMGIAALMGIITAEALYPAGYTTGGSEISDLGATRPPDSIIHQPSASIFNSVMMVGGVFTIVAAFFLYRAFRRTVPAVLLGLFGLGVLGVGVFPGDHEPAHSVFALMTFVTGGLAAIAAYMVETSPFRYYSVLLGTVPLVSIILYAALGDANPMAGLGNGGIERWVTYPILLWVTGFGGHLMARGPSR
ncbi:MAG TPA: DUF998 domain-containing protein [Thermoleophilia bacterium]|nr:DUF998 domain-containing protein [Thermoleophilia bacterium]